MTGVVVNGVGVRRRISARCVNRVLDSLSLGGGANHVEHNGREDRKERGGSAVFADVAFIGGIS